jgi:hypothetical protein
VRWPEVSIVEAAAGSVVEPPAAVEPTALESRLVKLGLPEIALEDAPAVEAPAVEAPAEEAAVEEAVAVEAAGGENADCRLFELLLDLADLGLDGGDLAEGVGTAHRSRTLGTRHRPWSP